ncbi:MAG: PKD domain-containing protein [Methanoregula sp.]|uniref:PKD domain-containing protein n=1 Tax=Methanoregula sp. TaxID=2052170 RepID=UPI0025D60D21|nr:PKD domain-containing protein [Methanoregula sp.]MCK9630650.1 PKD domain-containing protein [Methanoregula sp.]
MTRPLFSGRALAALVLVAIACGALCSMAGAAIPSDPGDLPVAPAAGFIADRLIGTAPFTVQFTDTSTGIPTEWSWDFGDGGTSTRQNPAYAYQKAGTYTVTLVTGNRYGSTRFALATPLTVRENIVVLDPDFTVNTSEGRVPLVVRFEDLSGGTPASWSWDFDNDGIVDSIEKNPVCVYNLPGNYTVNLTIANASRSKTIIRTDLILAKSRAPIAMYAANTTTGPVPLAVRFTDLSENLNITGWAWDFDNDTVIDSRERNATCVYKQPGNYTVRLAVTNEYETNSTAGSGFVLATTGMLADFSANVSEGTLPLAVQFSDISVGINITGWAWDFDNDTVIDSRDKNPVCIYTKPGDYSVVLTVFNEYGTDTVLGPGYVTVTTGMKPDFSANVTNGTSPLAVQFSDRSTGTDITGWAWDFDNDSVIDSTERDPLCVYNRPGNYTVNLSVTNVRGTNSTARQGFILVNTLVPVVAFTANATAGIPPLAVQFSDNSTGTGITGWAWDFDNDGIIDSTEKNPSCVYNRIGNFTVNLTVTNEYGRNTTSETDFITLTNGEPQARFAVNKTTGYTPLAVQFRDISAGINITGWAWDFDNDGIVDSTEKNPWCVYNLPGNYTINFTVMNAYGSGTVIRKGFVKVAG